jgi:tetratricopeptide (TPR) repeat protein
MEEHNALYDEAWGLAQRLIRHSSQPAAPPGWIARRRLLKARALFERALAINAAGWQSMWALGKIHQRLDENVQALSWFLRAADIQPDNPDITREASIAAMALGNGQQAVELSATALRTTPDDSGLLANHALALMLAGKLDDAVAFAMRAVLRSPGDRASRRVQALVGEVASGRRAQPKRLANI